MFKDASATQLTIVDWGFASTARTMRTVCGTDFYMPPEARALATSCGARMASPGAASHDESRVS